MICPFACFPCSRRLDDRNFNELNGLEQKLLIKLTKLIRQTTSTELLNDGPMLEAQGFYLFSQFGKAIKILTIMMTVFDLFAYHFSFWGPYF